MNVQTPEQLAARDIARMSAASDARHSARVAGIASEIGSDAVRLASTLRNASSDHLVAFCAELICQHRSERFEETDSAVALALSTICNEAARDEA